MNVITMQIKNQDIIFGGAYRRYIELIEKLLESNWNVFHISPKGFQNINHKNFYHLGIYDPFHSHSYVTFFFQTLIFMLLIKKKKNIDFIVVFSTIEALIAVFFKFFSSNTKVIICYHADEISSIEIEKENKFNKYFMMSLLKIISKYVLKRVDKIIFVSEYLRKNICKRLNYKEIDKTKVIYNNINTNRVIELSKEKPFIFDEKKKIIGFVGNLYSEGKGLKFLLNVFYKLKQKKSDILLIIIGIGPDYNKLISLTNKLNLQNDVIFVGFVQNPIKYIKSFDIMILPSRMEAFPLVILEALYVDTPVIASNVGGVPEILKYDDLLFNYGNENEVIRKLLKLLNNEKEYKRHLKLCENIKFDFIFDWGKEIITTLIDLT